MVYITGGLVDVLLDLARDADPDPVSAALAVTPAGDLSDATGIPADAPVFTDFYMPDAGGSVNAVFGVDLGIPHAQTQGRFVSHPVGELTVTRSDHLHEAVFVAVPPWNRESLAAFDRSGKRRTLTIVDAHPPERSLADT